MDLKTEAALQVIARYGLNKEANLAMLRRFHEFNRLAEHANPQIAEIGQKLVAQNARQIPKPFKPMIPVQSPTVIQKLAQALMGTVGASSTTGPRLMTPKAVNQATNAIKKVTGQSTLKPGIKGPSGL